MPITLNNDNYFSMQADIDYMSVSQFKDFAGTPFHTACEFTALKKVKNQIHLPATTSLLVGSYIDAYFEGTLEDFKADNPDLFKKTGDKGLKSEYIQADNIINRLNTDPKFMQFMSGQKQAIMTGNLFGTDWKIKMDSYHPDEMIVDLKVMRDVQPIWSDVINGYIDFIRYWGYDIQGAVYQKIVEINTGKKLPFYIAYATKESATDLDIIQIDQSFLDEALKFVEDHIEHVLNVKNEIITPEKCGTCSICKASKTIIAPKTLSELITASKKIKFGKVLEESVPNIPSEPIDIFAD